FGTLQASGHQGEADHVFGQLVHPERSLAVSRGHLTIQLDQ
ncbi:MAG: hypothetical protein RLZ86_1381, partial [Actinomycetota bacterium]